MTTFTLPELPYAYEALQPYMSRETLEYHHDKHHKAYIDKGNELIAGTGLEGKSLDEIVVACFKDPTKAGLFNQVGQHWNHVHFWNWMKPNGGGKKMPGNLEKAITESFGSWDKFKSDFTQAGMTQFGSGWCWLVTDENGKLSVMKTPNGENPLAQGKSAILGCDVWEHSYYIDYRNARAKYLDAFVDSLINWEYVTQMYEASLKIRAA
ncbi:MAG: superoxide dismutase [Alphaproteobacteria bacterium]|nr:superoxide dismutase [Alphaproteobacteria bacterium]